MLFVMSFDRSNFGSYSVHPMTALWITTPGKMEKLFTERRPAVYGDDWLIDVRLFRQIKFSL